MANLIAVYYGTMRCMCDEVEFNRLVTSVNEDEVKSQDKEGFFFNGKRAHMWHEISDSIAVVAETKEDAVTIILNELFGFYEKYDDGEIDKEKYAVAKVKFINWLLNSEDKVLVIDDWLLANYS